MSSWRRGGCCSARWAKSPWGRAILVSNPISGEVGAAALVHLTMWHSDNTTFQTPSAGRWVLQPVSVVWSQRYYSLVSNPISGEVGAAALIGFTKGTRKRSFKPHQRGGGCCSARWAKSPWGRAILVSNPISGEVGAAASLDPQER